MQQADLYRRHDWVTLPQDWRRCLAAPLAPDDEDALARWSDKGRPLVVARRREGDAPGQLRLGLAPPGKRRIGLVLSAEAATLRRRPPFLLDAIEHGAAFWPEALRDLAAAMAVAAPDTRVFGSFAWRFFAADPALIYVTRSSDIDLLLAPAPSRRLAATIGVLQHFERRWPAPRLDGEIALAGGDFMSWREYAARPAKVLFKGADHVSLRPFGDIDDLLRARAA
jgi:phosphoribosyl-dephospho-CoA transferase